MHVSAYLTLIWSVSVVLASNEIIRLTADNYYSNKTDLVVRNVITIGGFIIPGGQMFIEAFKLALNAVEKSRILPDYNYVLELIDDECSIAGGAILSARMLRSAFDNESKSIVPILAGPLCSGSEHTARFAKHFNFIALSVLSVVDGRYENREVEDKYFVLLPSIKVYYEATPALMVSQGWSSVYLISETLKIWRGVEEILFESLEKRNMTLVGVSKIPMLSNEFPDPEMFQMVVKEAVMSEARIFFIDTSFPTVLACWMYHYGLYGPGYVFIASIFNVFYPNSPSYVPWCTSNMLFEVMQSYLYFRVDFLLDMQPDKMDGFGVSGKMFDNALKSRLENPHWNAMKWHNMRGMPYEIAVSTATVLADIERELSLSGDSLRNWLTGTENFQTNGIYIAELLANITSKAVFTGLLTFKDDSARGSMAFYQVHYEDGTNIEAMRLESFAIYKDGVISVNSEMLKFRTKNGKAPYDRMRYFTVNEADKSTAVKASILAVTVLVVSLNIFRLIVDSYYFKERKFMISDVVGRIGIIMMASEGCLTFVEPSGAFCRSMILLMLIGLSLILVSMFSKLRIAHLLFSNAISHASIKHRDMAVFSTHRSRHTRPPKRRGSLFYGLFVKIDTDLSKRQKLILCGSATATLIVQTILSVLWIFVFDSVGSRNYYRGVEYAQNDQSTAYRYSSVTCRWDTKDNSQIIIPVILLALYALECIASIGGALSIPKGVTFHEIRHIKKLKWMSYFLGVALVASGVSVWTLSNSGNLLDMNLLLLILKIVFCSMATLFLGFSLRLR